MKRISALLAFIFLFSIHSSGQLSRRALFLGNSYTYVNNLPQLTADVAHSAGDTLHFYFYSPGGYTLDDHGSDTISQNRIMGGNWDYLVLQEQSQLPSFPFYFSNNLSGMCESYRTHHPCGEILFYMTWGRKNGDAGNCAAWPPVCTYIGMDTLIRQRYMDMTGLNHAEVSPVGAAWRYVRQHYPAIELYQTDESHPTEAGSYLAACCFYAAIFKKNPMLISYNYSLSQADANTLKQAAKLVVFDSLPSWNFTVHTPTVNFNYVVGNGAPNQVVFSNTTLFADSYLWNFGDGSSSMLKNPTHSYTNNGTYTVTLTAYNCSIDTIYQAMHQTTLSFCPFTPTVSPVSLTLCPGATDTLRTQSYSSYQWFDSYGLAIPGANHQYLVATGGNHYYVQASQNNCSERSVPVFVDMYSNLAVYEVAASGNLIAPDTACIGEAITLVFSSDKPPFPVDSQVDWSYNGQPIAGYHNDTLVITATGSYGAYLHHQFCPVLDVSMEPVNYVFVECTTSIPAQQSALPLSVYPNPSERFITVRLAEGQAGASYKILDVLGALLQSGDLSRQKTELDISMLPKGVYVLQTIGRSTQVTRFIKQ